MAKGKKKGKKGPPPPPPVEPLVFHIENFAIVETQETSLSVTPTVIQPMPDQPLSALAAQEETTCGQLRMHIEKNDQGKPEYQITYQKSGDPDPEVQEECKQRLLEGKKKVYPPPQLGYKLEEHGLPDIKATGWMKEPLTYPVLNEDIDFRKIKNKPKSKGDKLVMENPHKSAKPHQTLDKDQTTPHGAKSKSKGHEGSLGIWSSQRMLKEFMIYPAINNSPNLSNKPQTMSGSELDQDLMPYNIDALEEFIKKPFYATDNLTGKEIYVDPSQHKADDNGYYTVYDHTTGDNFVIDPPKLILLDPVTKKELVVDPRKPVGQYYAGQDEEGNPILMDTTEQQPYMYEDPVTGARLLVDQNRVKPFTVIDPRTGAEVRINPLQTDGKPYVYMDSDGVGYSVLPVMPGGTPIMYEDPESGEKAILGGPVMIRDPVTGEMKYQEGPFTMRNPQTGQSINQVGPIMKTNPDTGEVTLMSNPRYIKHPHTGELVLEPSVVYKMENGKAIPTMLDAEIEKAKELMLGKNMVWDEKLGVFLSRDAQKKLAERNQLREKMKTSASEEITGGYAAVAKTPSLDSLLDGVFSKPDRKRVKKFIEVQAEDQREMIRRLMADKKKLERSYMQNLLTQKEKRQSIFIQNLIQHFGTRLRYYDKIMFTSHVQEKLQAENEQVTNQVEEKITSENNRALDAMLIEMENEKRRLLDECNQKGTVNEFSIGCKPIDQELCDNMEYEDTNAIHRRTMEIYKNLKNTALNTFNEALLRENELIRRELKLCLDKEMNFIEKKIDELYVKICCQKYLIVT